MTERRRRKSSVVMLGLRGINGPQGGVETHVGALAPLLVERGWSIDVLARQAYMPGGRQSFRGVGIEPIWSPRSSKFEALVHTGLGVGLAALRRPDIVHIHAVGPALLTPAARLAGLKTLVTHHGYDYDRDKWGRIAKEILRLGEKMGMHWADAAVAVAENVARDMEARYGRRVHFQPNGVFMPGGPMGSDILHQFDLQAGRYVLNVSRLVPEKRQLDLVAAYSRLVSPDFKLVLVGGADHRSDYETRLRQAATAVPGIVMTGYQKGAALNDLFAHAGLFVLPSSHEGMPIALLEGLSHGTPVLASDIAANLGVGLEARHYFPLGDIEGLAQRMAHIMSAAPLPVERMAQIEMVRHRFSWDGVADDLSALYAAMMRRGPSRGPVLIRAAQSRSMTK